LSKSQKVLARFGTGGTALQRRPTPALYYLAFYYPNDEREIARNLAESRRVPQRQ
jgi:hypothetical protein